MDFPSPTPIPTSMDDSHDYQNVLLYLVLQDVGTFIVLKTYNMCMMMEINVN
jgi:hypothetical protein